MKALLLIFLHIIGMRAASEDTTYYEILGIDQTADLKDIKAAYRKLAKIYHPDKKGGSDEGFRRLAEAYQVLADEERRRDYDRYLEDEVHEEAFAALDFDPLQVFQDFFSFFRSNSGDKNDTYFEDMRRSTEAEPWFATEHQEMMYEPLYGDWFVRWTRHEEYYVANKNTIQYRDIVQDFAEVYNPYRHAFEYQAISQLHVVAQGTRPSHVLIQPLVPGGPPLQNGRYQLLLDDTCDLQIVDHDDILWSSETRAYHCQLVLKGPYVVLMGNFGVQWRSDDPGDVWDGAIVARLDGDAALSVYQRRPYELPAYLEPFAKQLTILRLFAPVERVQNKLFRDTCLSSTSPLGCFRLGRLLVRLARDALHLMDVLFHRLDTILDELM